MLTVKEINEVSFGKAGFSGYKPEDVDNFIDEVAASFQQLQAERDEAVKKTAELTAKVSELQAKNAEAQEKLAILAEKVEAYRNEEDGIKEAILSAQKLARGSVQEAKDKAQLILDDAQLNAKQILDGAKMEASKAAKEYMAQAEAKKEELEEVKRQVSAFRASLLEMYKKHLESINHIPVFRQKQRAAEEEPAVQPSPQASEVSGQPEVQQEELPPEEAYEEEPPVEEEPAPVPQRQVTYKQTVSQYGPTLHDKVDYTQEQPYLQDEGDYPADDDLTDVGIDVHTYSDIPESLQREKNSHFSNLEFGEGVEIGKKKRKR